MSCPVITSSLNITATRGNTFTYVTTATNTPTSFSATGLPSALVINTTTGVISGNPTSATGIYNVTLSATNSIGTGTTNLVLTLNDSPIITSNVTAAANPGRNFTYQITADNSPTSFNATGLPSGLNINLTNGLISGTPTSSAGNYTVTLSATNTIGTRTSPLTITLNSTTVITSSITTIATRGSAFTYQITTNNSSTSFGAIGLPSGLAINPSTGSISGTPTDAASTFNVILSATKTSTTSSITLVITLNAMPIITSTSTTTATREAAFAYKISANSYPTSFSATGLPSGLSINSSTGVISGTPSVAAGTFNVNLSAINTTGTGTQTLVLTLNSPPDIVTQPSSQTVNQGTSVSFSVTASGTNPLTYQWKFSNNNIFYSDITGATSSTYTINSVATDNSGYYKVITTNSIGNITSSIATLTVVGSSQIACFKKDTKILTNKGYILI